MIIEKPPFLMWENKRSVDISMQEIYNNISPAAKLQRFRQLPAQVIRKRDKVNPLGFSYYATQKPKQTSFNVQNIYSYIADPRSQILTLVSTWDLCQLVNTGYIWLTPPPGVSKHRERNIIFQTSKYSAWDALLVCMISFDGKDS